MRDFLFAFKPNCCYYIFLANLYFPQKSLCEYFFACSTPEACQPARKPGLASAGGALLEIYPFMIRV